MLIEERYDFITNVLKEKKTATVEELSALLGVSKDTIRRDLISLERKNILKRTFGGAVLSGKTATSFKHDERLSQLQAVKNRIAHAAVELIEKPSTMILDASTTIQALAPLLEGRQSRVVTNSLPTAQSLSFLSDCEVSILPGTLNKKQLYITGYDTIEKISKYYFDFCFLGVIALDSSGIYTHTEDEGLVKKAMVQHSKTTIVLADHSKFDTIGFYKISPLDCINIIITDEPLSPYLTDALSKAGIKLMVARPF